MRLHRITMHWLLSAALFGCTTAPVVDDKAADDTFHGSTGDGRSVVLTLSPNDHGITASGTIDGQPVVFSGAKKWRGVGVLMEPGGAYFPAAIWLGSDGDELTFEVEGQPAFSLVRGGNPSTTPGGHFTGKYKPAAAPSLPWRVSLQQHGELITGIAQVLGEPASVAGYVTDPNKAACVFTFADESQIHVELELDTTRNSMELLGIGSPIRMNKF